MMNDKSGLAGIPSLGGLCRIGFDRVGRGATCSFG